MKSIYSHQWLQTFFDEQLPSPEEIAEKLEKHSCEVEEVRTVNNGDTAYEMDILPNRSADCLAHYGIAKEIAAIFSLSMKKKYFQEQFSYGSTAEYIHTEKCDRYTILKIENIVLTETPSEIQKHLESIGQQRINPIVDLSNYILFDIGQPIHTFDAKKTSGRFGVRQAKKGETIALLGNEKVVLQESDIVITDASDNHGIALAGIKGGEETKVDESTKDIYIEIASFDSVSIRRTMRRTGCISDAALRFSQGLPPVMIGYAAQRVTEVFGTYGSITDSFDNRRVPLPKQRKTNVSVIGVNTLLGTAYTQKKVADTLDQLGFSYKHSESQKRFNVTVPIERPDIQDENDMIEEVGRILGYDAVPSTTPTNSRMHVLWMQLRNHLLPKRDEAHTKRFLILRTLQKIGFSEVITSSFCICCTQNCPDICCASNLCVAYPVVKGKGCLRSSLRPGIEKALEQNAYNGELLGLDTVQVAEIGSVFFESGEKVHLALGVRETLGRKKADIPAIEKAIRQMISMPGGFKDGIWETSLEEVETHTPDITTKPITTIQYAPPSKYPFILRDVAVFVPNGVSAAKTETLLQKNGGDYLQKINLFDSFEKNGRQSYAFRLVFQSGSETLDDETVNRQMDTLYKALKQNGYEVR